MKIIKDKLLELQSSKKECSYKQLCDYLEIPYYRGCQKDAQLKELGRICKYNKNGTKYKILEVYDNIIMLNDNRATTLPSIEFILLNELSKAEINGVLFASNKELLKLCYIINNNYYSILSNKDKNSLIIAEKYEFDESFIEYVDKAYDTLKPSLLSALKSMRNKKEIQMSVGYKLQKGDFGQFICVAITEELGKELNNLIRDKVHTTKRFHDMSYNNIDKWFEICNTANGDKKYQFSEDIMEYYKKQKE